MERSIDLQPTLTGARVLIRPLVPADWPALFSAAADPAIWEQHPASGRYREAEFREYFDGAIASGMAFAIIHRDSGAVMGSSRYHGYDAARREIEIGWSFLACDYWGGSYNLEIKQLLLAHAFQFVDTVVFWVGDTNYRSRRAMEKIGGVLREGTHTRMLGAVPCPHVVYEITKQNFKK